MVRWSYWITEAHHKIGCVTVWWSFPGLAWAAHPHADPVVLLEGASYGMGRECVAFAICTFWLHLGPSRQGLWGAGNAGEEVLPLSPVWTRCQVRGNLVRFLYRWLSGLGTNERTTCWKVSIVMINGGIWMLPTPIHEQPNLTAESSKCL